MWSSAFPPLPSFRLTPFLATLSVHPAIIDIIDRSAFDFLMQAMSLLTLLSHYFISYHEYRLVIDAENQANALNKTLKQARVTAMYHER